jgi:uncharacterized membrane protein HdeD (DUF308 family)
MPRIVAIVLLIAGIILLILNGLDLSEKDDNKGTWLRMASNVCVILVSIFMLYNFKKQRK